MKVAGAWECPVEEQYSAPAGFYDTPYIYSFDFNQAAVSLLNNPANGLQVALDGDSDFVLRRVVGASTLNAGGALGFQAYDSVRRRFYSLAIDPTQNFNLDMTVVPEKIYPASGQIWFDLATLVPAFRVSGAPPQNVVTTGQLAFQGVRRFPGVLEKPTYRYMEKPFAYRMQFTLNWIAYLWAGAVPVTELAAQMYVVPVNDYDFELLGMNLHDSVTGLYPLALDPPFKMTLYNKARQAVSKRPVLATYLFSNRAVAGAGTYYSRFPSPGIVYTAGSEIKFDIHSLLLAADLVPTAPVYDITFFGVRRVPV